MSSSGPVPSPDLSFQPDEHLEVYVSASENPSHFWIQILGVRSLQLDKLLEEMSCLYAVGTPTVSNHVPVGVFIYYPASPLLSLNPSCIMH